MAFKKLEPLGSNGTDAIVALTADHRRVKALFREFSAVKANGVKGNGVKGNGGQNGTDKATLVKSICTELKIHAEIEEEIFFPAMRARINDDSLMDEALVGHADAKKIIEELEGMEPEDELYDAKVTGLGAEIDHHAAEEEGHMFPRAKKAKVDTAGLGEQMAQRKQALKATLYVTGQGLGRQLKSASSR
jgi:hypothetical protein